MADMALVTTIAVGNYEAQPGQRVAYQVPTDFGEGLQYTLDSLRTFVAATKLVDQETASLVLDEYVLWDAPPILMRGRTKMNVVAYFAKFAATMDFDTKFVEIHEHSPTDLDFETFVVFKVMPRRTLLFPPTYLLPRVLNIKASIALCVRGGKAKISVVKGRIHNWPVLPTPLRQLVAFSMGTLGMWTQPLWSSMLWMVGDDKSHLKQG